MIMVGFKEAVVDETTPVVQAIRDFLWAGDPLQHRPECFLELQKRKPDPPGMMGLNSVPRTSPPATS
jgi:hypothetical protein